MANGKKNGNGLHHACYGCGSEHGHCICAHLVLSYALFALGLLALLFAWIAEAGGQTVLGFSASYLFHNAIALMVAGLFFKKKF